MTNRHLEDLKQFYLLLNDLEKKVGGTRKLADCSGRMDWPSRGVYFFREAGEFRTDSGAGLRVVRVGTHALTPTARTMLWSRLLQHRGVADGSGGNHRGSIFRLLVGTALIKQRGYDSATWGKGKTTPAEGRAKEAAIEREVSTAICDMPLLWLGVNDPPGKESERGQIERNAIALLSNFGKTQPVDAPSSSWLGHDCNRPRVQQSGLWNSRHVNEKYDPSFLETLQRQIAGMDDSS